MGSSCSSDRSSTAVDITNSEKKKIPTPTAQTNSISTPIHDTHTHNPQTVNTNNTQKQQSKDGQENFNTINFISSSAASSSSSTAANNNTTTTTTPALQKNSLPSASATTTTESPLSPSVYTSEDLINGTLMLLSQAAECSPISGVSVVVTLLKCCYELFNSYKKKEKWLAEFMLYVHQIEIDIVNANQIFQRKEYCELLEKKLQSTQLFLEEIKKQHSFLSIFTSHSNQTKLLKLKEEFEHIKMSALNTMLTEMKTDTNQSLEIAEGIKQQLNINKQLLEELIVRNEKSAEEELLLSRLEPLDFSVDIETHASRFMKGTRLNIIQDVKKWLDNNTNSNNNLNNPNQNQKQKDSTPTIEEKKEQLLEQPVSSSTISSSPPVTVQSSSLSSSSSRLYWIKGGAGTGKSCLSAVLCEQFSESIVAIHFCTHYMQRRKQPKTIIKSLAYQLAQRIPEYKTLLKEIILTLYGDSTNTNGGTSNQSLSNSDVDSKYTVRELFKQLLVDPLFKIQQDSNNNNTTEDQNKKHHNYVILIDALDESEDGGRNELLDILSTEISKLPPFIRFLVTSRPEVVIVDKLSKYQPTEIVCESEHNLNDLKLYFTDCLQNVLSSPNDLPNAINILLAKSEGIFLCAALMCKQHRLDRNQQQQEEDNMYQENNNDDEETRNYSLKPLTLSELTGWPSGLSNFYLETMRRMLKIVEKNNSLTNNRSNANQVKLNYIGVSGIELSSVVQLYQSIAVILTSFEPLSLLCLSELLGMSDYFQLYRLLQPLRSLFPITQSNKQSSHKQSATPSTVVSPTTLILIYHKSIKDWFTSEQRLQTQDEMCFYINTKEVHNVIAQRCWTRLLVTNNNNNISTTKTQFPVSISAAASTDSQEHTHTAASQNPNQNLTTSITSVVSCFSSPSPSSHIQLHLPLLVVDAVKKIASINPNQTTITTSNTNIIDLLSSNNLSAQHFSSSFLYFSICSSVPHCLAANNLVAATFFLCHPQYLHLTALLQYIPMLGKYYVEIEQKRQQFLQNITTIAPTDNNLLSTEKTNVSEHCYWSSVISDATVLLHYLQQFHRFYRLNNQKLLKHAELVYQYGLTFPEDNICQFSRVLCEQWYEQWKYREMGLVQWKNKPQKLDSLLLKINTGAVVLSVALNRESTKIVCNSGHNANIYDALSGNLLMTLEHISGVTHVCFSSDDELIASTSYSENTVRLWNADNGMCIHTFTGHTGSVCFSRNNKYIVSGSEDKSIRLWNVESKELVRVITVDSSVGSVAYSHDDHFIVSADWSCRVSLWKADSGELIRQFTGHTDRVTSVCFSPDDKYIASGSWDKSIRVWQMESGECVNELKGHSGWLQSVAYSHSGEFLISGSYDSSVCIWNSVSGTLLRTLKGHSNWVLSVQMSADDRYLITASVDHTICVWDFSGLIASSSIISSGYTKPIICLAVSTDGQYVASGGEDKIVCLWNAVSGLLIKRFEGHEDRVRSVCFHPLDSNTFLSTAWDKTIRQWNVQSGECVTTIHTKDQYNTCVVYTCDAKYIIHAAKNNIYIWDAVSLQLLKTLQGRIDRIYSLSCSPTDAQTIVSGSEDGIRIWNISQGKEVRKSEGHNGWIWVDYSSDGKYIVSGGEDKSVRVWNADSGECLKTLVGHESKVRSVCFSADSKYVISASWDQSVRVWSVESGQCVSVLLHDSELNVVCLSADGSTLFTGSNDILSYPFDPLVSSPLFSSASTHTSCVYSFGLESRYSGFQLLSSWPTLEGHTNDVSSVCFSGDNKLIVSAGEDNTVRLWNVDNGTCIHTFTGHTKQVKSVCFSHNNKYIVSGSDDENIRVWNVDTKELVRVITVRFDVKSVAYSHNDQYIVCGDGSRVCIWNAESGQLIREFEGHTKHVRSVCFSPDDQHIASGSDDKSVRVWQVESGVCVKELQGHSEAVLSVAYSHSGQFLISSGSDGSVCIWNSLSGTLLRTLHGHHISMQCVQMSGDDKYLISAGSEICVWDFSDLISSSSRINIGGTKTISCIDVSPDNQYIVSGGFDNIVCLWSAVSGLLIKRFEGHTEGVESVCFHPHDSNTFISTAEDQTICQWNAQSGECVATISTQEEFNECVVYTCDGKHIIHTANNKIYVWDAVSLQLLKTLKGDDEIILAVSCSPIDAQTIVSCGRDCITAWNISEGKQIKKLAVYTEHALSLVVSVSYSSDGKYIVMAGHDNTVRVWNADSDKCLKTLVTNTIWWPSSVRSVCFSADDKYVINSEHKCVRVWSVESGQCISVIMYDSEVESVCVSADGSTLFTASDDIRSYSLQQLINPPSLSLTSSVDTCCVYLFELSSGFQLLSLS